MYGKCGEKDVEIIDAHLSELPENAVVVNLGCGPNIQMELNNFARAVRKFQFNSTLIFADRDAKHIQNTIWMPGPPRTKVVTLNAATATTALGEGKVDLIVALGLFGDLHSTTTPEGTGKDAWRAVLRECMRLLTVNGKLIVGNSCDRQPIEEFRAVAEVVGFSTTSYPPSRAVWGSEKSDEQRYLMVCKKNKEA